MRSSTKRFNVDLIHLEIFRFIAGVGHGHDQTVLRLVLDTIILMMISIPIAEVVTLLQADRLQEHIEVRRARRRLAFIRVARVQAHRAALVAIPDVWGPRVNHIFESHPTDLNHVVPVMRKISMFVLVKNTLIMMLIFLVAVKRAIIV